MHPIFLCKHLLLIDWLKKEIKHEKKMNKATQKNHLVFKKRVNKVKIVIRVIWLMWK